MRTTDPTTQSMTAFLANVSRDKADTLLLIFSCALVLLPFSAHSPVWINVCAGLLIGWRIWLTLTGKRLPSKWLLLLITGLLCAGVYLHFHTWLGKDAGIVFLIVLACLKMLEMHARRDVIALVFTCYFLLLGQLIYSQSLLSALFILLCTAFLISTQLSFQYREMAPGFLTRLSSGFKVLGLAIPLALVLFLLFPRMQGPLWGNQPGNSAGISGLSDSMEIGNVAELALSDQIAFRVKFFDKIPEPAKLYWRALILDTYNGKRWSATIMPDQPKITLPVDPLAVIQEIIMEPHNQRWLFGLDRPNNMLHTASQSPGIDSYLTPGWEMRSVKPIQDRIRYTIASSVNHPEYQPDEANTAKRQGLLLPEGYNPLTVQWAQRLGQTTTDPLQLAQLVLKFFRQQPFRYTFNPPLLGMNQIDDFMFATQAGFCEHYASAFVVAMRAMGVPARVVTGYQGGELNSVDGLMTVRQSDAHAWAEIWINKRGWLRIDPTAAVDPARVEHGGRAVLQGSGLINFNQQTWLLNLTKQLRSRWDATNSAWNLWALNYNLEKQKNLLSNLAGIQNPQATQIGVAMMLAASLVVAIISLLLLSKPARLSPLDKMYQRFCQAMSKRGYPRMPHEGAIAYNQRLQEVFHNPAIDKFLTLYTQFKYGNNTEPNHLFILKKQLKLCLQLKL